MVILAANSGFVSSPLAVSNHAAHVFLNAMPISFLAGGGGWQWVKAVQGNDQVILKMALSDYRIFTLERQWAEELGIPPPPPKKRSLMK